MMEISKINFTYIVWGIFGAVDIFNWMVDIGTWWMVKLVLLLLHRLRFRLILSVRTKRKKDKNTWIIHPVIHFVNYSCNK